MIGYVTIGALDVEQAMPFYDAVLGAIGYERQFFDGGWAGYGPRGGDADTFICPPFDGQAARGGNGIMIAFKAPSTDAVRAAHAAALEHGGEDEGGPGAATGGIDHLLRRLHARPDRQQDRSLRQDLGTSEGPGGGPRPFSRVKRPTALRCGVEADRRRAIPVRSLQAPG